MIRSDILQNDLKVEGEFVTEEVLREEWKWSETLIHRLVLLLSGFPLLSLYFIIGVLENPF